MWVAIVMWEVWNDSHDSGHVLGAFAPGDSDPHKQSLILIVSFMMVKEFIVL